MRASAAVCLAVSGLLTACAGKVDYVRPSHYAVPTNTKVIERPRDAVWNASVPELGKQFFVINNLDRSSGLINISYSGDPERYIDCGRIISYVKNARGERTYDFPGSRAQMSYEVMDPGNGLFFLDRSMSLEGRVNLIFEEVSAGQTRVTANTRYVVQRNTTVRNVNNLQTTQSHSVSFNTGGFGEFPSNPQGTPTCVANGALERDILNAIR